jgi:hypothetical protein
MPSRARNPQPSGCHMRASSRIAQPWNSGILDLVRTPAGGNT